MRAPLNVAMPNKTTTAQGFFPKTLLISIQSGHRKYGTEQGFRQKSY